MLIARGVHSFVCVLNAEKALSRRDAGLFAPRKTKFHWMCVCVCGHKLFLRKGRLGYIYCAETLADTHTCFIFIGQWVRRAIVAAIWWAAPPRTAKNTKWLNNRNEFFLNKNTKTYIIIINAMKSPPIPRHAPRALHIRGTYT